MRKRLLRDLKKKFPGKKLELVFIEEAPGPLEAYASTQRQTLMIDGEKIKYSWRPPAEVITTEGVYERLIHWCEKGIKDLIWSEEIDNDVSAKAK